MDIDAETLGIPVTDYEARVTMPASEFSRIVRDLSSLSESVRIEVSKEGVRFISDGESANGSILLKQTEAARERYANYGDDDEDDEEAQGNICDDECPECGYLVCESCAVDTSSGQYAQCSFQLSNSVLIPNLFTR